MLNVRSRLVSLWISQVARCLADYCLLMFVVLQVALPGEEQSSAAWHQVTPFFIAPLILLAPVNGALSNSLPKRWVLVGSAAFCLCMTALSGAFLGAQGNPWLWCVGLALINTGHAVYSPARYALLPAAAQDTRLPLSRVMGWMEMGSAAGVAAGLLLGWHLHGVSWPEAMAALGWEPTLTAERWRVWQFSVAVATAVGLNGIAVLAALPVHFRSDVRRAESATQALARFFRDGRLILKDAEARASLLGLAYFLGLIAAGASAVVTYAQSASFENQRAAVPPAMLLVSIGAAVGSSATAVQGHPRRVLGFVPLAALGLLVALAWAAVGLSLTCACLLFGVMGGLMNVPLRATYLTAIPAEGRGNGMAVMNAANYLSMTALAMVPFALARLPSVTPAGQLWLLVALAAAGAWLAWRVLLRETLEQLAEIVLWPMYRIRVGGPGCYQLPLRGPLLVVANHTAWFDPLWLAKVLPRRVTPLMTSRYFDLPVMHWLMRHVVGAIRVQAATFRREAPELQEAVATLDRGGCVLIFPEGFMKRRPEQAVRNFGQGVWHILRQRPATPVVVCWIEGGWGSYTSYCGGPPTVHKHLDWWRRIEIAIEAPQVFDPALLADQRATRNYLMRTCLSARRHLGLEPLPLQHAEESPENDGLRGEDDVQ